MGEEGYGGEEWAGVRFIKPEEHIDQKYSHFFNFLMQNTLEEPRAIVRILPVQYNLIFLIFKGGLLEQF